MSAKSLCMVVLLFLSGMCVTLWTIQFLTGWTWYHLRFRTFLSIAAYRARDPDTSLCLSQNNETVISCELAAMTRLIQFRFTKDLKHNTYHQPDTIIPYSRQQMHQLWNWTFPSPTHLPVSVTMHDIIGNYKCNWIVHRKQKRTNLPLSTSELDKVKANLSKTGVIVAIHGGALVMGSAGHLVPYLTLLSSYMTEEIETVHASGIAPPILAFEYRLAPECAFPCQMADVSFIINKYLNQELGVDMNKIYLIGDSSGGSLSLLFMQKLAGIYDYHPEFNVGGAVLISPGCDWTLNGGKGSWQTNAEYDPVIFYDSIKLYRNYAFGIYEVDKQIHKMVRNNDSAYDEQQCQAVENKIQFDSPKISACFGRFDGLPSLYVTVSELEALYDDGVTVYKKVIAAKQSAVRPKEYENVTYTLEVNYGSSLHELPMMAGVIPEATKTLRHIARFLVGLTASLDHDVHI